MQPPPGEDPASPSTHRRGPLTQPALETWGRALGRALQAPAFVLLQGPMGVGKSVLARAIAAGLGVREPMPSPTFNLLLRYPLADGRTVVHLDLYRIASPDELHELGWFDLGQDGEVVLVEWPERAGPFRPDPAWALRLAPGPTPDTRLLDVCHPESGGEASVDVF